MSKGLIIVSKYEIAFDSDIYTDIYNFYWGDIKYMYWYQRISEVVDFMAQNEIEDILLIADTWEYRDFPQHMGKELRQKVKDYNLYILPEHLIKYGRKSDKVEENYLKIDDTKPRAVPFFFFTTDMCNLNCKGCSNYCNIAEDPKMMTKNEFVKQMKKLKGKFWGVERIAFMGGEPLLCKELGEVLLSARELFPDVTMELVTNGLLLPNMSADFYEVIRQTHTRIKISVYKPTKEKLEEIKKVLEKEKVLDDVYWDSDKAKFVKSGLLSPNENPEKVHANCRANDCHTYREGKFYKCSKEAMEYKFYDKYQLERPYRAEGIDVSDNSIDGWTINKMLSQPVEACSYCTNDFVWYDWEVKRRDEAEIDDWIVR